MRAQVHSRDELRDLLDEADAVLYPSRWEVKTFLASPASFCPGTFKTS